MERFGSRVIRDYMPDQHREFYGQLPFIFVGHADKAGWPWASILFNKPGFITSSDDKTLDINALPVTGDPLADGLQPGTRLGLLGIEPPTRRRNRLAAHIVEHTDEHIHLAVDQAFGNCPQYIQTRELGVSNARIFSEEFGPASLQRDADQATVEFKPLAVANEAIVEFTDSQVEQAWSEGDGSLLDFAEAHGLNPEFGCRSGQCGACKTTLVAGPVVYQTEPSSPLQGDEVLLCCAVPARAEGEDVARLAVKL
jgi:ferredoxin/predicted pyridoxine 5'-phosphate oxidase superfamily flavin-nucleotide-binding protein